MNICPRGEFMNSSLRLLKDITYGKICLIRRRMFSCPAYY